MCPLSPSPGSPTQKVVAVTPRWSGEEGGAASAGAVVGDAMVGGSVAGSGTPTEAGRRGGVEGRDERAPPAVAPAAAAPPSAARTTRDAKSRRRRRTTDMRPAFPLRLRRRSTARGDGQ